MRRPFSCGARVPECGYGLSDAWAELLCGMWDPLGSWIELVSPALQGGLLPPDHQGSPQTVTWGSLSLDKMSHKINHHTAVLQTSLILQPPKNTQEHPREVFFQFMRSGKGYEPQKEPAGGRRERKQSRFAISPRGIRQSPMGSSSGSSTPLSGHLGGSSHMPDAFAAWCGHSSSLAHLL